MPIFVIRCRSAPGTIYDITHAGRKRALNRLVLDGILERIFHSMVRWCVRVL